MQELENMLRAEGADLVGFADLGGVPGVPLPYGVAVAVRLTPGLVASIQEGPTLEYYHTYLALNERLDRIVSAGAQYLQSKGYAAQAMTVTHVDAPEKGRVPLPHKTVATRAGLGWIGKCALLVTRAYGSAVRISTILTDAPLSCGEPVNRSSCGGCGVCAEVCPAGAVHGKTWDVTVDREELIDPLRCRETARAIMSERVGKTITICGRCFAHCPYTKAYLAREGIAT